MGGIASGKARKERKTLKEHLLLLLGEGEVQDDLCLALLNKALAGDIRAFEVIRDTIGEKPSDKPSKNAASNPALPPAKIVIYPVTAKTGVPPN